MDPEKLKLQNDPLRYCTRIFITVRARRQVKGEEAEEKVEDMQQIISPQLLVEDKEQIKIQVAQYNTRGASQKYVSVKTLTYLILITII